ncbi:alpha/beta hydrolase, partial [Patescibacteria group bacterium]|nr:alpha/beta hydrolase [Patescibacteria group bacterium]
KSLTIIKGATHCFDEEGKEEEVFKETLAWVQEHR